MPTPQNLDLDLSKSCLGLFCFSVTLAKVTSQAVSGIWIAQIENCQSRMLHFVVAACLPKSHDVTSAMPRVL